MISTGPPWHPPAPASLHMKNQTNGTHGTLMELMPTTWVQHWITTYVTKFKSQKRDKDSGHCGVFPFKNSNATNIIKRSGGHFCLVIVQCTSEPSPCRYFQSHWNCPTPGPAPTFRHFHSDHSINNSTACSSNVSSLVTVQEQNPSPPCAHVRLPNSSTTFSSNSKPVTTP
jgi:hypothetical protein